jgi:hypothetical protein
MEQLSIGDKVKVIGGNNEFGQPTMNNDVGVIYSFGTKYKVKGKDTIEVYVRFQDKYTETHVFNDYHLQKQE